MAGLRGNQAFLVESIQTAKGSEPTSWSDTLYFAGGNIAPTHGTAQLSETDSNRQAGSFYTTTTAVEGAPEVYARPATIHHPLQYVLGTSVKSGTAGEYVHTITPAAALPYVTYGRGIGATLFEQFNDCKVSECTVSAKTGGPLMCSFNVIGRTSVRQASEWSAGLAPPAASTAAPFNFNQATVTLSGAETKLISDFTITIANNVTLQQTDSQIPFDVVEGQFAVTGGFTIIFENLEQYNAYNYGSTGGTTQSGVIYATALKIKIEIEAKEYITFELPSVAYTDFPVEPEPGGAPIVVAAKFAAQRSASPFITAIVGNKVEK